MLRVEKIRKYIQDYRKTHKRDTDSWVDRCAHVLKKLDEAERRIAQLEKDKVK